MTEPMRATVARLVRPQPERARGSPPRASPGPRRPRCRVDPASADQSSAAPAAPMSPISSSTWSGIPSVRSWIAATTSRAPGRPSARRSDTIVAGLVLGQASKAHLLGLALREEPAPPLAHRDARVELVAAVRPDDHERQLGGAPARPSRAPRASGRRPGGGPRAPAASASPRLPRRQGRPRCRASAAAAVDGRHRASRTRSSAASRSAMRVPSSVERGRSGASCGRAPGTRRPGTSRSPGYVPPRATRKPMPAACRSIEPRSRVLPMPASPARNSTWPRPSHGRLEPAAGEREEVVATDEDRADERADEVHRRIVGVPPRARIGRSTDAARRTAGDATCRAAGVAGPTGRHRRHCRAGVAVAVSRRR